MEEQKPTTGNEDVEAHLLPPAERPPADRLPPAERPPVERDDDPDVELHTLVERPPQE